MAGGTDVVVHGDRSIRFLIDITQLGLHYIRRQDQQWVIGATATMAALENSPEIRALANGILAKAASTCGSVQVRNMATIGGNLASGAPSADTATPLLVLDALVVAAGAKGRRRIPLTKFFAGPHRTLLGDALIVEVVLPLPPPGKRTAYSFQKLGRTASDISLVNVAAGLGFDAKGKCQWARIALGAVAPTPLRARIAEQQLTGQVLDKALITEVSEQVARDVDPITDVRATAEYRRDMSRVLTSRALRECAVLAGCTI